MQEKKAFEADVRSFAAIEETMDKSGLTICYAAKIRLNEALDKNRMRLAWKNTRAGEAFLQVSTREKSVTRVSEEFWQEPDFLEIPEESFKTAHLQANITQQEIEKYKVCSHLIVCQDNLMLQLIIRIPHSISDGTSFMIIVNSLLKQYDNLVAPSEQPPLPKPASQLQPVVKKDFIESFKKRYHRDLINFKNTTPHSIEENRDSGAYLTTGCGTPEGAENLLSYCRANGITIGSFLAAAVTFINAKLTKTFNEDFKLDVDYNLRERFPEKIGNKIVSCFVGWPSLRPNAELSDTLLEVAKKIHAELKLHMSEESHHQFGSIQELLSEHEAVYDEIAAKNNRVTSSFNFSNVGKYKFSLKYEKCEILELFCTGEGWANICEYCTLFQTTDKLCISITHLNKPEYNAAAQKMVESLIEFTEDPKAHENYVLSSVIV
ncbi:unnamed protein product [Oikopleura dioica]|uniref:Phthiocerol/phthiodiolone dimycocerosyl transferase C-terminal domain-containing protein n=1 Tax=Oikopleura dioica TaxID=34765 RepID=E4XSV3_OIKDI|nr:unnamed protein product [Oikopleura dioica]